MNCKDRRGVVELLAASQNKAVGMKTAVGLADFVQALALKKKQTKLLGVGEGQV